MTSVTTTSAATAIQANCPECDASVPFRREPYRGEIARCPACSAELEVRSINPIKLELAPEVEEDWGE